MNNAAIVWPMVPLALITLWLYIPMSGARVRSVKQGGTKGSVYKLNVGEPEESLQFSNAIRNQYETPVLFYAVCLAAAAVDAVSMVMVVLAWAYAIIKIVHVAIHVITNNLRHRRPVFTIAYVIVAAMWLMLVVHMTGIA